MADVVGYATLPIVPSFRGVTSDIVSGISGPMTNAGRVGGLNFVKGMKATLVGGAVVGTVVAGFKGLYNIGGIVDDVTDTIRIGTGAQGEALRGLVGDAMAVGNQVPIALGDIGAAVTQVNQRLGYSGPLLQGFTARLLEVGRLQDAPVAINDVTAALSGFRVPGSEANATLDRLFQISQATGVPVARLTSSLATQGSVLGRLGFSITDSASLLGLLDKAGVNSTQVVRSLSAGIVRLARDGEAPADAFARVTGELQDYIDAGDEAAALDLAGQVFGTRGAAQFVGALQSGALNIRDIQAAIGSTGDTILGVAAETNDFNENLQLLRNNLVDRLAPAGDAVFGVFNAGFGRLVQWVIGLPPLDQVFAPLLDIVGPIAAQVGGALAPAFAQVWAAISPLIPGLLELWTTASPVMIVLQALLPVLPTLAALFSQVITVVAQLAAGILPVLIPIVSQVAQILGGVLAAVLPIILDLVAQLAPVFLNLVTALMPVIVAVLSLLSPILDLITPLLSLIGPILSPLIDLFVMLIDTALTPLIGVLTAVLPPILGIVSGIVTSLLPVIKAITDVLGGLIDFVVGVFSGNWEKAWRGIVRVFSGIFNGIVAIVRGVINTAIDVVNGIIGSINGVAGAISDATGGAINVRIPRIPRLALGADVLAKPGGTLAVLGEAGQAETVTNLGVTNRALRTTTALAEAALAGGFGGNVHVAVYLDGELLRPIAVEVYRDQDDKAGDDVARRKRPKP